jgi:hypothetical protein
LLQQQAAEMLAQASGKPRFGRKNNPDLFFQELHRNF